MIVFTLDALADDSHRRHLIDPSQSPNLYSLQTYWAKKWLPCPTWINNNTGELFNANYPAYYEACEGDAPIHASIGVLKMLLHCDAPIQIWSDRPENIRSKSELWMNEFIFPCAWNDWRIKLRPISDDRPQEKLFELWKNDYLSEPCGYQRSIDMVFSSHKPTIDMFRAMGVFVFDCNQNL